MTAYHLKNCVWEITLACCFSCVHCGSRGGRARENELTTEECLDVAAQLADLGCRRVSLIGGEVFLRGDWPVIAKALTDRAIRVTIITNGYLFTEDLIAQLKEAGIESVAVSMDGLETIHDKYRQKGSFLRTQKAIRIQWDTRDEREQMKGIERFVKEAQKMVVVMSRIIEEKQKVSRILNQT
ncbi:MAG: radical SAM protein [Lachnospiraceae bacterium]|nr:radical SAM protein [Lachnospiraceae bacterium]